MADRRRLPIPLKVDIPSDIAAIQTRIAQITRRRRRTGCSADCRDGDDGGRPVGVHDLPPADDGAAQRAGAAVDADASERSHHLAVRPTRQPHGARQRVSPRNHIAAAQGTPIAAAMAGTVVAAGPDGGYGNLITVDDGNGLTTRYAHCSQIYARVGERVAPGDVIGAVGMTGRATGPHLHFEVRQDDRAVDPSPYLAGATP